jgi:hypothetical protein
VIVLEIIVGALLMLCGIVIGAALAMVLCDREKD